MLSPLEENGPVYAMFYPLDWFVSRVLRNCPSKRPNGIYYLLHGQHFGGAEL